MKTIRVLIGMILLLLIIFLILKYRKNMKTADNQCNKVADYDKKISIWSTVAGNSNKSKLEDMNINFDKISMATKKVFGEAISNTKYEDKECEIDTFTYFFEIKGGFEKDTYEDEPYLIPYLVEDSDLAVIVVPGGGFGYKSIDGKTKTGKEVAETLNRNGINAFVLHYRSNPYEYPIPYLDLQRAIKYLKYHCQEYGIDKNKISLLGYSAGGNLIAHLINGIKDKDIYPRDYQKDEIDQENSSISSAAMIYPAMTFNDNIPMLFAMFNAKDVKNNTSRKELLDLMDNTKHFTSSNVRQFISYGDSDTVVGDKETQKYIAKAKKENTDITVAVAKGGKHGYNQSQYMDKYLKWLK